MVIGDVVEAAVDVVIDVANPVDVPGAPMKSRRWRRFWIGVIVTLLVLLGVVMVLGAN